MDVDLRSESEVIEAREIIRDDEFWYADGNIILIAKNHAFKVYCGILSQHSKVFRGLLSLPQPESAERMDGCPIIHLIDSPDDVRYMLRYLLDYKKHFLVTKQITFVAAAALIRLGHKYQFEALQEEGTALLKSHFPDRYGMWFATQRRGVSFQDQPWLCDAMAAVNLAHLIGEDSVLPTALYACCQLDTSTLITGTAYADGVVERLSSEDLVACLDGRMELQRVLAACLRYICTREDPNDEIDRTCDRQTCLQDVTKVLENQARERRWVDTDAHWICNGMLDVGECYTMNCCEGCLEVLQAKGDRAFMSIWNKLPGMFRLSIENWHDMRVDNMGPDEMGPEGPWRRWY